MSGEKKTRWKGRGGGIEGDGETQSRQRKLGGGRSWVKVDSEAYRVLI